MSITNTYGCTVYGTASLVVEPGIKDSVAFEIVDNDGNQIGAVLIDKDHAKRMAAQLIEICNAGCMKPNAARIQQLALENVVVKRSLDLARHSEASYTEALELAVIEMAAQVAHSLEALTQAAMRAPTPIFITKE